MGAKRKAKKNRLAYKEVSFILKAENNPSLFMNKERTKKIKPVVMIEMNMNLRMCFFL